MQTHPKNDTSLFNLSLITRRITIPITHIASASLESTLREYISTVYEGKCQVEGYIRPGKKFCDIIEISGGCVNGAYIIYTVMFSCYICNPLEGMTLQCLVVSSIQGGGIRAHIYSSEKDAPRDAILVIFITNGEQDKIYNQNDELSIRVIGSRFELNDAFISVIGEII
jgi:hypothetical protein